MADIKIKRVLRRETGSMVQKLIDAFDNPICIQDADKNSLLSNQAFQNLSPQEQKVLDEFPVQRGNNIYGAVSGDKGDRIAGLIILLIASEVDKKSLGGETLNLYREINLLYNLAEKLATSPEVQPVTEMTLEEASRLIQSSVGMVLLRQDESNQFNTVAVMGDIMLDSISLDSEIGIMNYIANTGKGEIVNEILQDQRHSEYESNFSSLACAPLISNNQTIGIIALLCKKSIAYTAGELKLLNALAFQAAPAIESALLYEKTVREAKAREERLQQQIQELRIELDEAKQKEKVAEITESNYFQSLRKQADSLRKIMED